MGQKPEAENDNRQAGHPDALASGPIKVGVAYATALRQLWLDVQLPPGGTVGDAITKSGILIKFPEINLEKSKVGIFGKIVKLEDQPEEGDRIEIYRPITADPKQVKRRRSEGDEEE